MLLNRCVECQGTNLDPLTIASGAGLVLLVLVFIVAASRSHGGRKVLSRAAAVAKEGLHDHVAGEMYDAALGDPEEEEEEDAEGEAKRRADKTSDNDQAERDQKSAELRRSLNTKFKIVLGIYQIQDALPWTIPTVSFPKAFEALVAWTSFLEFNVVQILPMSCLRPFNFFDKLFAMTVLPILLALLIFAIGAAVAVCASAKHAREVRTQTFGWFLLLTFLVFPSVSATVLRFYNCVSFDEGLADGSTETLKVLEADYDISCKSPSYEGAWSAYAFIMMFVYPIGIPSLYWIQLFRYRKQINPDVDTSRLSEIAESDDGRPRSASAEAYARLSERLALTRRDSSTRNLMKQMLDLNSVSAAEVQARKLAKRDADESIHHLCFLFEEYDLPRLYCSFCEPIALNTGTSRVATNLSFSSASVSSRSPDCSSLFTRSRPPRLPSAS